MIHLAIDPRTAVLCAGLVYLTMPAIVWRVLHRRHNAVNLALWCGGGLMLGVTYLLYSVRGLWPDLLTVTLANLLAYTSYALRIGALRQQLGLPTQARRLAAGFTLALLAFQLADLHGLRTRVALNLLLVTGAAIWMSQLAWRISRQDDGRSARLIAWSYGVFSVGVTAQFITFVLAGGGGTLMSTRLDFVAMLLGAFMANVCGHVGYVGMAYEALQAKDRRQAGLLASEQAQRMAAELQTEALRERLAEREEFVRVLAHEVRQPLNNASAALQSAQAALEHHGAPDATAVAGRVARAQSVIGQIVGTLDNTLAATALLASPDRISCRDADVSVLLHLSLGDLDVTQRSRVVVERIARTRTAAMDIGLMRLALRNLLTNALTYSSAASTVVLRLTDSDDPLALVFEVLDRGPGVDEALLPRIFERGVRGAHAHPGHGIGLYVVQRVMALHGGEVDLRPNEGGGTVFRLTLPQDV